MIRAVLTVIMVVIAWSGAFLLIMIAVPAPQEMWSLALLALSPLLGVLFGIAIGQLLYGRRP